MYNDAMVQGKKKRGGEGGRGRRKLKKVEGG